MKRLFTVPVMAAAVVFVVNGHQATAQQQAGVSAAVRGQVALSRASQNIVGKKVVSGEAIFLGDAIKSGKASGLQVMLLDETVFTIGPNSEMSIDEFVYDPSTNAGKVAASVTKGVFRFITGKIARKRPEDMIVRLPTATIGIRGTIVAGAVRTGAGDAAVDKLFEGLRGKAPGAENARDFAVLLGPGSENNTNDTGGEFILAPGGVQKAAMGRNAGTSLAQALGFGGAGGDAVTVSRTGWGAASDATGRVFGPFTVPAGLTQGLTAPLSAQPVSGSKGKASDANANEASGYDGSTAGEDSGQSLEVVRDIVKVIKTEVTKEESEEKDGAVTAALEAGEDVAFSSPGGPGSVPVPIADVIANFPGASSASANFAVNQNGIAFNFQASINFCCGQLFVDFQNITINGVHDFGSAFANVNFSDLPGGLAIESGLPDSVSSGSDGSCNQCTLSGAMFTVDTITAGLTFDNGGASVGSDFNGQTASGTGSVQ